MAKVVRGLLHATADVPDHPVLPEWASQPQKRLPAQLVVLDNGTAVETVTFPAAYCVGYHEVFRSGNDHLGSYVCHFTLSDPDGWTWERGRAMPYVAPTAREHGGPGAALVSGGPALAPPAAAWAAAQAQALAPARIAGMYAAYVAGKKTPRSQDQWWGEPGKRGGARRTVEGCLGEYQADKLFAAQGHTKLNHGGQLVGLLDPPRGKGLDGVWRNATPPPEYIITETKVTTIAGTKPKLSVGQMSNEWILRDKRLPRAVGEVEARRIQRALSKDQIDRRLLHVDTDGKLHESGIDKFGKLVVPNTPIK